MSTESDKYALYRSAGLLERYHITRQYLKLDTCVLVAGKFTSASQRKLSPETLYPAVAHALTVHAGLSVCIVDERSSNPKFGRSIEVDITKAIRFLDRHEDELSSIMEDEFMNVIDANSGLPLWRITVLTSSNVLVFAWHHTIGDGQSGLAVLRTLLSGLNKVSGATRPEPYASLGVIKTPNTLKLVPRLEMLTDLSVSFTTLFFAISGLLIPTGWFKRKVWTGNNVINSTCDIDKTNVRIVSISPPTASRLLALSKQHGATLTSTLYILVVSALSKVIAENDTKHRFTRISTVVPTSFRPLARIPPSVMCEAVSSYSKNVPLLLTGFSWEKAAAYNRELHRNIPKTRETVGLLKYLRGRYEDFFKGKLGKRRERSFEISNVGVFKLNVEDEMASPDDAEWKIEKTYFAQDDGVTGAALKINVAGSPDGGVNICITWGASAIDETLAENFAKGFKTSIEKLVEHD